MTPRGRILFGLGTLVVLSGATYVGVYTGLLPAGRLDAMELQSTIRDDLAERLGTTVTVDCPDDVWQQKGLITDCTVRRLDTGTVTGVRVVQDDHRGHYTYDVSNPTLLAQAPPPPPPPAPDFSWLDEVELDESEGECTRADQALLARIESRPADGMGEITVPSGYVVQTERGLVVGGFLTSFDPTVPVDGEFGAWFVHPDGSIYAYSGAARDYTAWPTTGNVATTARIDQVRACADDNAG
jgi:hypothetical protein